MSDHTDAMDAAAFWRQYPVPISFDEPCEVAGALIEFQDYKNPAGEHYPRLRIQRKDGSVAVVIASQARLLAALADVHKPAVGDRIRIRYIGESDRAAFGLNKTKEFEVEVIRKGSQSRERSHGTSGEVNRSENASETGVK